LYRTKIISVSKHEYRTNYLTVIYHKTDIKIGCSNSKSGNYRQCLTSCKDKGPCYTCCRICTKFTAN